MRVGWKIKNEKSKKERNEWEKRKKERIVIIFERKKTKRKKERNEVEKESYKTVSESDR